MDNVVEYLLEVLAGKNAEYIQYIDAKCAGTTVAKIEIVKSDFFSRDVYGTKESMPQVPFETLDGIPILFGKALVVEKKDGIICYADFVASAMFMCSRYEEWINPSLRDEHGRFLGKYSVLNEAKCIQRPLIDEYAKWIEDKLGLLGIKKSNKQEFSFNLTHDIDRPWEKINIRDAVKFFGYNLIREKKLVLWPFLNCLGIYWENPYDTFDELLACDKQLIDTTKIGTAIYFVLANEKEEPITLSYINDKKFLVLLKRLLEYNVELGLHISYFAGKNLELVGEQKKILEKRSGRGIKSSRNHVLRSCEPEDLQCLLDNGITEDYTMGYADIIGFRLGTSRVIKWINPKLLEVTGLSLHPLNIMDCSLTNSSYMGLDYEHALIESKKIIDMVYLNNGELSLLFHNSEMIKRSNNYIPRLYVDLLTYVKELCVKKEYGLDE